MNFLKMNIKKYSWSLTLGVTILITLKFGFIINTSDVL